MVLCDLCGKYFGVGPHKGNRQSLPRHKVLVCTSCLRGDWHGVGPEQSERLTVKPLT